MKLAWDQVGERTFETGVDHGVLYLPNDSGVYDTGVAWNGLVTISETPTGADAVPFYADNIKYLNIVATEYFGCTIDAFTYPDEFAECDGTIQPEPGVTIGQQSRKLFGLAYRTKKGNDVDGADFGHKIHIVYGALAAPSQKAYGTVNDKPEAITFSWVITTTPVYVGTDTKPTATIVIDSTKVDATALGILEDILFGTTGADARLPLPPEVLGIFAGTITLVTTVEPTYNSSTDIITIPTVAGVVYSHAGVDLPSGAFGPITADTVINAHPAAGYEFTDESDRDWTIVLA